MPIRAVCFDAVGTLIHPEPAAVEVYAQVSRRFGSRCDQKEIGRRFRAAFKRQEDFDRANGWQTSEPREVERWRTIVGEVLDDVTNAEDCFLELYAHFAQAGAWRCEPKVAGVVATLRQRGCRIGLASNYDRRLRNVIAGLEPLAGIEHVVISSEVGWRKPSPKFFAALTAAARVPAEDILHVGDDPINDYEGALGAGCRALLYDPDDETQFKQRIRSLSELPGLIDKSWESGSQ